MAYLNEARIEAAMRRQEADLARRDAGFGRHEADAVGRVASIGCRDAGAGHQAVGAGRLGGEAAWQGGGDLDRDAETSSQVALGEGQTCNENTASRRCGRTLTAEQVNLLEWLESQCSVTRVWLDRLIAEGDPDDMVSVIHRQAAWLDLVRARLDGT